MIDGLLALAGDGKDGLELADLVLDNYSRQQRPVSRGPPGAGAANRLGERSSPSMLS